MPPENPKDLPTAEPASTPLDPLTTWRIESLKRKQRADSFFNSLSSEESARLLEWLDRFDDLVDVHNRIIAPPPEGLGHQVSLTALRRLRAHFRAILLIDRTEEMLDNITDFELESDLTQTSRVQKAINTLLHHRAYELAMTTPGSHAMKEILDNIQKLSVLEYRRQKILLQRERLAKR